VGDDVGVPTQAAAVTLRRNSFIGFYSVQITNRVAEFLESIPTQQVCPISLHSAGTFDHHPLNVATSIGQAEHRSAAVIGCGNALEVLATFKAVQKVIHRLLGHVRPTCELGWADAVGSGTLKDVHVGRSEVRMTSGLQFGEQPPTDDEVEAPDEGGEQGRVH
jgi:hypothetical protein